MRPFDYQRPGSLDEALAALGAVAPGEARVIAGGQSLLLAMKDRLRTPSVLVSLAGVPEAQGIGYEADGSLRIGAAVTYAEVERAELEGVHRLLATASSDIADTPVRMMGTPAGALCEADPRFDVPVLLSLLDASVEIAGAGGTRAVPAADFVQGFNRTACGPQEIVTALRLPAANGKRASFEKMRLRRFDSAIASAACATEREGDEITAARIVVGAVRTAPTRAVRAEQVLVGRPWSEDLGREAAEAAAAEIEPEPYGGLYGPDYKRRVLPALIRRALGRNFDQED